ncbi:TetR/AcrR family transcriptional regulator [Cohnella thailandensis]|uniref:TetR/AcrR family transcriptional regulator n=1 Tax=Cohnella thailandensis TaxID=557557 RepID=A0A841SQP6_9BACL|nr:TetR/AcrR family transcriptional regulator [Cohnella thailandensis]MBB6633512.1 TetR/AcrR family transcriptional regulator [Cohnella thailandensis]
MPVTSSRLGGPTDRRIVRTQQLVRDALLSLATEKPFSEILVRDITERANVNRSTFYAHYQDKFELMDKIAEEKLSALGKLASPEYGLSAPPFQTDFETPDPYFLALFEHLAENETFYRIILTRMQDSSLSDRMLESIREFFYLRITSAQPSQKLLVPLDILLDYASSSAMGTIRRWFEQNRIYSPHYMALQLTRISELGFYRAMGYEAG